MKMKKSEKKMLRFVLVAAILVLSQALEEFGGKKKNG